MLQSFAHLSARERSGCGIVKSLTGREAALMPDPTLLISAPEWEKITDSSVPEGVVVYVTEYNAALYQTAKEEA